MPADPVRAAEPAPAVDGRTARRDRNRIAVLDAVLELFAEGDLDPAPEDVARRSGVSLRSVYRYVADREDLVRAAIARHVERVGHLFVIPDAGAGSRAERIDRFVTARLELYEAIAATHRASRRRAPTNELIRRQLEAGRRAMCAQLEGQFAVELDALPTRARRTVVVALDTLTQMESLDHLHLHHGLSNRQVREVLTTTIERML